MNQNRKTLPIIIIWGLENRMTYILSIITIVGKFY